ncbi:MAG: hypothetical protein HY216_09235 [Candidatus Rokubacteria bacterium]|nr:hypothetical protein [Candidatus Rokubacteria bacterium]
MRSERVLRNERGTILPTALIVMLVMSSLTMGLLALAANEPKVAANLVSGDQALALAEAGVENAIWALNHTAAAGITYPGTIPARYNNALPHVAIGTLVAFDVGSYSITIVPSGADATITSTGWLFDAAGQPRAKRTVTVVVTSLAPPNLPPPSFLDPPGSLNVKGELQTTGNTTIDARPSTCGAKVGAYTKDETEIQGSAAIFGGDGNNQKNQTPGDYKQNQAASSFDPFTMNQDQLNLLKSIAKANGTYYGPGSPPPGSSTYTGTVNFTSSPKVPDGIVFVDTISGNPIGTPPTAADLATVNVSGNGTSSGWLIVMGSIRMNGTVTYNGLVYAANDFTGLGNLTINGSVVSLNKVDTVASSVDSTSSGASNINYDCNTVRNAALGGNPPNRPSGFLIKPGTWHELSS